MSQEYSKKEKSGFQPELDANRLCAHTTHILVNRKYFPEEVQQTIVPKVVELVLGIAEKTNVANSIDVRPTLPKEQLSANYKHRIRLQNDVIKDIKLLKSQIRVFKLGYHLRAHKANSWTRLANETLASITSWRDSETKSLYSLL